MKYFEDQIAFRYCKWENPSLGLFSWDCQTRDSQMVLRDPMTVYLVESVFKRVKGTDSAQIPALLISNCVIAMNVA